MSLRSECRGETDLGLCTTSAFAERLPLQRHSFCMYRSCAQTWMRLSSTFWYSEHIANSSGKTKKKCQGKHTLGVCFAPPCSSAGHMFAAPRSRFNFYWRIIRFHKIGSDKMSSKMDATENPGSFEMQVSPLRCKWVIRDVSEACQSFNMQVRLSRCKCVGM